MNSNKAMMARRSDAVPRGVGQIHPIFAERAENCRVWDVEGRNISILLAVSRCSIPAICILQVVAAVEDQLKKLSHTCFQVLAYEPYLALCEKMNQKVPGDFAKKTLLVTTGSEAVENAVKNRPRGNRAQRYHRLHRRLSRPYPLHPVANRESEPVLRRYGLNAGPRLSRPLPVRAARRQR